MGCGRTYRLRSIGKQALQCIEDPAQLTKPMGVELRNIREREDVAEDLREGCLDDHTRRTIVLGGREDTLYRRERNAR